MTYLVLSTKKEKHSPWRWRDRIGGYQTRKLADSWLMPGPEVEKKLNDVKYKAIEHYFLPRRD